MAQKLRIDRIWWRNVQPGEFYNIERHPQLEGGGGALYIEIPNSIVPVTLNFLNVTGVDELPITIEAGVVGQPGLTGTIEFHSKAGGRMRIACQNRQQTNFQRHPAWTADRGFPTAPDNVSTTEEARQYFPEGGLRIYIAKSIEGDYYAGFTKGPRPQNMEYNHPMWQLYPQGSVSGDVIEANYQGGLRWDMTDKINDILASWDAGRNALLYGPPATGKTRLISELFQALNAPAQAKRGILLDPDDGETPFSRPEQEIAIPQPIKVVWTTFHQSYGYEDFVLGLRPEITADGTRLQPWAGVFLDAALELSDPESQYKSVVIFIDEINRGNAARIFGEFMTFLDFDYRDGGLVPLPLPLRQLTYDCGHSEEIRRPGGKAISIPEGFTFPKHVYIVSTMNSVDRAAVPIDSALARRFDRIEMRPDLNILAAHWSLDKTAISRPTEENWGRLSPFETGYLLLDRLNVSIASDLGTEFELGHGLLTPILANKTAADGTKQPVEERDTWRSLAKIWDDVLFPQLEDRYSGRPEQLMDLLHVDSAPPDGGYAWTLRTAMGGTVETRTLAPVRVSELDIDVIKRSFRWLTR